MPTATWRAGALFAWPAVSGSRGKLRGRLEAAEVQRERVLKCRAAAEGRDGGTFFGSPNNPRIVRLFSQPVEIPVSGHMLLVKNADWPGIVGFLGTVLGKHGINIANMSLAREGVGGEALTVLEVDTVPSPAALDELAKDPAIKSARVVTL